MKIFTGVNDDISSVRERQRETEITDNDSLKEQNPQSVVTLVHKHYTKLKLTDEWASLSFDLWGSLKINYYIVFPSSVIHPPTLKAGKFIAHPFNHHFPTCVKSKPTHHVDPPNFPIQNSKQYPPSTVGPAVIPLTQCSRLTNPTEWDRPCKFPIFIQALEVIL